MIEAMLQVDEGSLQKLRGFFESIGVRARTNGLLEWHNEDLSFSIKIWVASWVWVSMTEVRFLRREFELMLRSAGVDLIAILEIHDQFEPPPKPTRCPNCRYEFTPGEEEVVGLWRGKLWPDYGGTTG